MNLGESRITNYSPTIRKFDPLINVILKILEKKITSFLYSAVLSQFWKGSWPLKQLGPAAAIRRHYSEKLGNTAGPVWTNQSAAQELVTNHIQAAGRNQKVARELVPAVSLFSATRSDTSSHSGNNVNHLIISSWWYSMLFLWIGRSDEIWKQLQ